MVTLSVADFRIGALPRSLTLMAIGERLIRRRFDVQAVKMLGSGYRGGFGLMPDLRRYSLLIFWRSADPLASDIDATRHLFERGADRVDHFRLRPLAWHGTWGGVDPIEDGTRWTRDADHSVSTKESDNSHAGRQIAVLTRATVRIPRLIEFHRHVPSVSRAIESADGVEYFTSLGEVPVVRQATFSVWKDENAMKRFSYASGTSHREVVRRTRERNWYREDLFARFTIEEWITDGT